MTTATAERVYPPCCHPGKMCSPVIGDCICFCKECSRRRNEDDWPEHDVPEHECPYEIFLNDPITQAYGVGSEMIHLYSCAVCDAREDDR